MKPHSPCTAPPRRGRGGAQVEARRGGRVRVRAYHRPGEELAHVHVPAVYVTPDQVGVVPFEVRRSPGAAGQDTVPETGGEALYLGLYPPGHVEGRPVRDVAVGPDGVLARGGARGVEEALLGEQDEGPLGVLSARDGGLTGGDLIQRAAEVDGPGPQALLGAPRDRPVEREVHLEDARSVTVPFEGAFVSFGEVLPCNVQKLARRHVEEDRPGFRDLFHGADPDAGEDLTAQRDQVRGEGVGYALGPASRQGPAEGVTQSAEDHPEQRARPFLERQKRVGGVAREERAGPLAPERGLREPPRGAQRTQAGGRQGQGVSGQVCGAGERRLYPPSVFG